MASTLLQILTSKRGNRRVVGPPVSVGGGVEVAVVQLLYPGDPSLGRGNILQGRAHSRCLGPLSKCRSGPVQTRHIRTAKSHGCSGLILTLVQVCHEVRIQRHALLAPSNGRVPSAKLVRHFCVVTVSQEVVAPHQPLQCVPVCWVGGRNGLIGIQGRLKLGCIAALLPEAVRSGHVARVDSGLAGCSHLVGSLVGTTACGKQNKN